MQKLRILLIAIVCAALAPLAWALVPITFFPETGTATVCADSKLRITFDTTATLGTSGQIRIYNSGNTLLKTIDIANNVTTKTVGSVIMNYNKVLIVGNTAWIDPGNSFFSYNTSYYVQVDPTVFPGYGGIADTVSWAFTTKPAAPTLGSDIFVAADGSGDFATWQGAIDFLPAANTVARTLHIAAGTYVEQVNCVSKNKLTFQGANRDTTILEYPNNNTFQNQNNITAGTDNRILMELQSDDSTIRDVTIWNTTPFGGSQAEALRVKQSNRVILRDANFKSFQDTLQLDFRVYGYNLYVEGDVDYVWGSGGGVYFDKCTFKSLHNGYLTQARNNSGPAAIPGGPYGYIFVDCNLLAAPGVTSVYFNRFDTGAFPYSNVAMVNCSMDPAYINSLGYLYTNGGKTAPSAGLWEYQSVDQLGRPISTAGRTTSTLQLTMTQAAILRVPQNVVGGGDSWNPKISLPNDASPLGYASVNDLSQNGTTGGVAGTTTTVTNQTQLEAACAGNTAGVVLVSGAITLTPTGHLVFVGSNKTIVGSGSTAQLVGGGLALSSVQNVIIKNLTIKDSYVMGDFEGKTTNTSCVRLTNTHHVWLDHCLFSRANSSLVEISNNSDYVTASWSIFSYHNAAGTFGQGNPQAERITVHHCWFLNTNQASTFNNQAFVHHYDNYFTGVTAQANTSAPSTNLLLENNYFKQTVNPHTSTGGAIQASGNLYYSTSGSQDVNTTGTLSVPYTYSLDPAGNVPALVQAGAGPGGGNVNSDSLLKTVKVAFRPTTETLAYGYLEDNGATSGTHSLFQYGWDADNSAAAFWRTNSNPVSGDTVPTEVDPRRNGGIGLGARTWEIGLAKGIYSVAVNTGDPDGPPYAGISANNTLLLETTNTLTDGDGADQYDAYQATVQVTDGRLSVKQGAGGSNARINFIEITPLSIFSTTTSTTSTAVVKTVSNGGVAADIVGAAALTTALATATDGSEFDIIEGTTYTVTAPVAINSSATRGNITIKSLVPNVVFLGTGSNLLCTVATAGGPMRLNMSGIQFLGRGTGNVMQITQSPTQANGTTVTMTNCRVEQTNNGSSNSGLIFASGASDATLATAANVGTTTLVANNCVFRSKNGNQRAAIDLRGVNLSNLRMYLTSCQLYNDWTPTAATASNGTICLDSNAGYYMHLRLTNCLLYNTATNVSGGRACINGGGSSSGRFVRSELTCTSCTFISPYNAAVYFKETAADITNNLGGNTITFNRCTFDNHNMADAIGVIGSLTYPQYSPALNLAFSNGGTMPLTTVKLYNSLLLSPKDSTTVANTGSTVARAVNLAGAVSLTAYGNTFVSESDLGNAGIGTADATPTYVAKNNIFYDYKAPISGTSSAGTQQTATATLIGGASNTGNLVVGPYDDAEAGATHVYTSNIFGTLGTDFRPLAGSPALNTADTDPAIAAAGGTLDLDQVARDGTPNIGAFETLSTSPALPVELSAFNLE